MIRSIRLLFMLVPFLLAACGGAAPAVPEANITMAPAQTTAEPTAASTPTAVEPTVAPTTQPDATAEATTQPDATAEATTQPDATADATAQPDVTADATAAGAITLQHALGETTLAAPARQVIALEWTYAEDLLALGMQPLGVADIEGYKNWVKTPVPLDEAVNDVGTRNEPNLEKLTALKPDLIIAVKFRHEAIYPQLSSIAPTIVIDPYPTDPSITQYDEMRSSLLLIADATGKRGEGEAVLAAMEDTFAKGRAAIEAAGKSGETFALAQAWSDGNAATIRLFTDNAFATQVVSQLGLSNAWDDAEFQPYGFSTVSIEALPALGETNFFYVVQNDDDVFAMSAVKPVWDSMPFVKSGRAYPLGGDTWLFGGPLSAQLLVDVIVDALVPSGTAQGS